MADELTARQREVLELFVAAARRFDPAPTYREVCEALGFSSSHAAFCHCAALVKKGWLEHGAKNTSRSFTLTNFTRSFYGLPPRRAA